jgi:effector-binding domain-containing protein
VFIAVPHDVRVTTVTERRTAVVAVATTWKDFPALWKRLLDEVYAALATGVARQSGHNVMLYQDDLPNVEVGVEVEAPFAATGRVVPSALPGGVVAVTVHRGPYTDLDAAHRAVHDWCAANDRRLAGPRWEIYGDWSENPAELETEVFYLLA